MEKGAIVFLADDKKSKTDNMYEDEYEIMIPAGSYKEVPNGKMIYMIKKSEFGNYKLLGEATGINFHHALTIGAKHCEDFFIRLSGYYYVKNAITEKFEKELNKQYITVAFYENKN